MERMTRTLYILTIIALLVCCGQRNNLTEMKEIQTGDKFEIIYQPEAATHSGQQLKIIPVDPYFEPTKEQQKAAINYLVAKYKNSEIRSILTSQVEFIDQGENFDSVFCNHCGQTIEVEFWQEAMDNSYQHSFSDLTIQTPCCHKSSNLNDLNYEMPAGFSKYQLKIIDPDYDDNQKNELIRNLGDILKIEIRLIWAHY